MILQVKDLSFSYGSRRVLHNISFDVKEGEFLSVLGPNGVGKSTLFRCILGNLKGYGGSVSVDGDDLRSISQREKARRIAYIPQVHRPTFGYTVLDMVLMGTSRQLSSFAQPGEEQIRIAKDALNQIGVAHLADRDFSHLSGGEQQLVLVARAIAQQANILVMDEPTSALDYGNQIRVLQKVKKLSQEGYTVLLSTHNPQHAMSFADRILALAGGTVAAIGTPAETLTPELMATLYAIEVDFVETPVGRMIQPQIGGSSL